VDGPSKTAEYVATFRAVESARPAGERLFDDPYASCFLDGRLKLGARLASNRLGQSLVCRYIDRNWPGSRPSAVIRTKLIDDVVTAALEGGAEQVAILGAGYDTRGLRLNAAVSVPVFELDPEKMPEFLGERGLRPIWDLSTAEALAREPGLKGGAGAPSFYRVAEAEVLPGR